MIVHGMGVILVWMKTSMQRGMAVTEVKQPPMVVFVASTAPINKERVRERKRDREGNRRVKCVNMWGVFTLDITSSFFPSSVSHFSTPPPQVRRILKKEEIMD
jgi:hypothetical protein